MSESRVLAATQKGIYDIESSTPVAFRGSLVSALVAGQDAFWAIVNKHEVHRSQDLSVWSRVGMVEDYEIGCLLPTDTGVFVGSEEAHLYRLNVADGTVSMVDAFEALDDRENWFTPWGGPPAVRSIAWDGAHTMFVNVHVGGILRSTDMGRSFEQIIEIKTDVHEVYFHRESSILLAAAGRGFAQSADSGESWEMTCEGLHGCYMRAVTVVGRQTLASASNGPHGDKGAVYVRPLGSTGAFEQCQDGLPDWFGGNVDTGSISSSGGTVALGAPRGAIYVSEDGGRRWECARSDLSSIHGVLVV